MLPEAYPFFVPRSALVSSSFLLGNLFTGYALLALHTLTQCSHCFSLRLLWDSNVLFGLKEPISRATIEAIESYYLTWWNGPMAVKMFLHVMVSPLLILTRKKRSTIANDRCSYSSFQSSPNSQDTLKPLTTSRVDPFVSSFHHQKGGEEEANLFRANSHAHFNCFALHRYHGSFNPNHCCVSRERFSISIAYGAKSYSYSQ